jgi:ABC-type multidrug transport system ATPase subunit
MYSIEAVGLSHQFFNGDRALDQVNLRVREGSIYGFLGPNGAGKTTTLRLLLGLLKKQKGEIRVFGKSFDEHRIEILQNIGSLIESPSMYSHLTAVENLTVWQKIYQCPKNRIPEVLKLVGLADTGRKKAGQFSLGMKQRLGIAAALLHSPTLLVLDEPTNGLDPGGIIEMRELLRTLNKNEGITIVISSHLLPEIEKLVTDIGIINKGKMLFEGPLDELMRRQQEASYLAFETNNNTAALQLIQSQHIEAHLKDENIILPQLPKPVIARLNQALVQQNIEVYGIATMTKDLESIFMNLTHEN